REVALDILVGEQWYAGGDLAQERELVQVLGPGRVGLGIAAQLECPRLGRVALDQTRALQVREVSVHRAWRGEPDCLTDLAHRRRIPVLVHVVGQELPDLLLSACQHRGTSGSGAVTNICSTSKASGLPGRRQES